MLINLMNNSKVYDKSKWVLSWIVLLCAVVLNSCYPSFPWFGRCLGWLGVMLVVSLCVGTTVLGKQFVAFVKVARIELYKISWPKRQEIVRITTIVGFVVLILSVMLWFIDSSVMLFVGWLAGQ